MKKRTTMYEGARRTIRCGCTNPDEHDWWGNISNTTDYPSKGCKTAYFNSGEFNRMCEKCDHFFWFAYKTNKPTI